MVNSEMTAPEGGLERAGPYSLDRCPAKAGAKCTRCRVMAEPGISRPPNPLTVRCVYSVRWEALARVGVAGQSVAPLRPLGGVLRGFPRDASVVPCMYVKIHGMYCKKIDRCGCYYANSGMVFSAALGASIYKRVPLTHPPHATLFDAAALC